MRIAEGTRGRRRLRPAKPCRVARVVGIAAEPVEELAQRGRVVKVTSQKRCNFVSA